MDRKTILNIISHSNDSFDLTCENDQKELLLLAEKLLSFSMISVSEYKEFIELESPPLMFKLAVKLVESRRLIMNISTPLTVGIVFAMWGEHHRLNKKSKINPHGENSLLTKVEQLNWITQDSNVLWKLYPVDDGCPHNSFGIAHRIAQDDESREQIGRASCRERVFRAV